MKALVAPGVPRDNTGVIKPLLVSVVVPTVPMVRVLALTEEGVPPEVVTRRETYGLAGMKPVTLKALHDKVSEIITFFAVNVPLTVKG